VSGTVVRESESILIGGAPYGGYIPEYISAELPFKNRMKPPILEISLGSNTGLDALVEGTPDNW
jgi:hypothetical protein